MVLDFSFPWKRSEVGICAYLVQGIHKVICIATKRASCIEGGTNIVYWIERSHILLQQIWLDGSCDYSMNTKPCGCMPQRHISLCVSYTP